MNCEFLIIQDIIIIIKIIACRTKSYTNAQTTIQVDIHYRGRIDTHAMIFIIIIITFMMAFFFSFFVPLRSRCIPPSHVFGTVIQVIIITMFLDQGVGDRVRDRSDVFWTIIQGIIIMNRCLIIFQILAVKKIPVFFVATWCSVWHRGAAFGAAERICQNLSSLTNRTGFYGQTEQLFI